MDPPVQKHWQVLSFNGDTIIQFCLPLPNPGTNERNARLLSATDVWCRLVVVGFLFSKQAETDCVEIVVVGLFLAGESR